MIYELYGLSLVFWCCDLGDALSTGLCVCFCFCGWVLGLCVLFSFLFFTDKRNFIFHSSLFVCFFFFLFDWLGVSWKLINFSYLINGWWFWIWFLRGFILHFLAGLGLYRFFYSKVFSVDVFYLMVPFVPFLALLCLLAYFFFFFDLFWLFLKLFILWFFLYWI